ncbi:MAG: antitoxin [Chloroflexi bacterium]|nr:antitoxin [Chloroflexota bacterium]
MYDRRLQLLLDPERYERVAARARRRKVSVATVIREAIDTAIPAADTDRRGAADRILAASPIPLPDDPADLRRELDGAHDRG